MEFFCNRNMFEKHCQICGIDVKKEASPKRFGKYFCSEEHAEKHVKLRMEQEEREARETRRRSSGC